VIDVATLSVIRRWALHEQMSIHEIARRTGLSRDPHAYLRDVPTKSSCRVAGGSVDRCTRRQGEWPERLR